MKKIEQMSFLGFEAAAVEKPKRAIRLSKTPTPASGMTPAASVVKMATDLADTPHTPQGAEISHPTQPLNALPAKPALPVPQRPQVSEDTDHEAIAQTLDSHPDYRVLRRLVPQTDYGSLQGQATRRVIVLDTETTGLDSKNEKIIELAMLSSIPVISVIWLGMALPGSSNDS